MPCHISRPRTHLAAACPSHIPPTCQRTHPLQAADGRRRPRRLAAAVSIAAAAAAHIRHAQGNCCCYCCGCCLLIMPSCVAFAPTLHGCVGTLDALLCCRQGTENALAMLQEIHRCAKPLKASSMQYDAAQNHRHAAGCAHLSLRPCRPVHTILLPFGIAAITAATIAVCCKAAKLLLLLATVIRYIGCRVTTSPGCSNLEALSC